MITADSVRRAYHIGKQEELSDDEVLIEVYKDLKDALERRIELARKVTNLKKVIERQRRTIDMVSGHVTMIAEQIQTHNHLVQSLNKDEPNEPSILDRI